MKNLIKIDEESGVPLIGCIAFGIIDRSTSLLQVRPISSCSLKCIYCSTNANNYLMHPVNYEVELNYMLKWLKYVLDFKDEAEINLDSTGEVLMYKKINELIKEVKNLKKVKRISMQTNGVLLNEKKVKEFEKSGLNQINLSLNSLDEKKANFLSGVECYDVNKIKKVVEIINKSKIELLIAPVWLSKVNDEDIGDIIRFCKKLNCKIGIQKYEIYKYGRKLKKAKLLNWWNFYEQLRKWEKEFNVKLILRKQELGIKKAVSLPLIFKKNEKVYVEIKAEGWLKEQMIGVAKERAISINNCDNKIDDMVRIKILENRDNIYIGEIY